MTGAIPAAAAKARLHAGGEIALLDVREHGQYGEGHPFLAVPCPYSRLEITVGALVPRRTAPVLLVDNGDGVADKAAARLADLGYTDIGWIDGGAPAWAAAGFTLFKGVNVPSKTLGELVEEEWHVPMLPPEALDAWRAEGRRFGLFDGRPFSEYAKMTIPGARAMPNGELPHRLDGAISDPATPVVVNCAGRTRGIIGAAGLMVTGIANPVFALENGTQGWALSGRSLAHGRAADPLPAEEAGESRARGRALAERSGIPWLSGEEVTALAADETRTLYFLDVRLAEEFAKGSHPDAVHAPGGQLIQATDQWIGVRRARVVTACDTGLRSTLAAFWLKQMGYEVYVLPDVAAQGDWRLARPAEPKKPELPPLPEIDATAAVTAVEAGAALLDLRSAMDFRTGHLAPARWAIRPRLGEAGLGTGEPVCLIADVEVAALAASDLREMGVPRIARVTGNPAVWRAAGLPVVASPNEPDDAAAIDFLFFVHDRHDGNLDAARRYLAWELGLTHQLDQAERAEYRLETIAFG
jgi:rhodanese-related sulfurtransferase